MVLSVVVIVRMVVWSGSEIDGVAITSLCLLILVAGGESWSGEDARRYHSYRHRTRGLVGLDHSLPGPGELLFIIAGTTQPRQLARILPPATTPPYHSW